MDREQLKDELCHVLAMFKNGTTCQRFNRAYQHYTGHPLKTANLGYKNLDELMMSFPELVERHTDHGGINTYTLKANPQGKSTEHLTASQSNGSYLEDTGRPFLPERAEAQSNAAACRQKITGNRNASKRTARALMTKATKKSPARKTDYGYNSKQNRYADQRAEEGPNAGSSLSGNHFDSFYGRVEPTYQKPQAAEAAPSKKPLPIIWNTASMPKEATGPHSSDPEEDQQSSCRKPEPKKSVPPFYPLPVIWNTASLPKASAGPRLYQSEKQEQRNGPKAIKTHAETQRVENNYAPRAAAGEKKTLEKAVCQLKQSSVDALVWPNSHNHPISQERPRGGGMRPVFESDGKRADLFGKTKGKHDSKTQLTGGRPLGRIHAGNRSEFASEDYFSDDEEDHDFFSPLIHTLRSEEIVDLSDTSDELDVEDGVEVKVVKLLEPNLITFVIIDEDRKNAFKLLLKRMMDTYDGYKCAPLQKPETGSYVAVKCQNHWLRAVVCEVFETSTALLFYCDIGELHKIAFSNIFPLYRQFNDVPQVAFVGKMTNVPDKLWYGSVDSIDVWLKERTLNRKVKVVMQRITRFMEVGADPVDVDFYMEENGQEVHLNTVVKNKCMETADSSGKTFTALQQVLDELQDGS